MQGPLPLVQSCVEPFQRDADGRPCLPATPAALYGFGSLIRACETLILDLFRRNLVSGTTHTCLGQEFCQMAVVRTLTGPHDTVWSNHRNHGHFLTYSGNFLGLLAEVMGRDAGVCGGAGGSQHLAAPGFHSSGVQGGLAPIAVGEALQRKRRGERGLTALFIGDGTLGEGVLYESLNLASIWHLPVLFVVEHNGIAQTTPTAATIGGGSICARGRAFGVPSWQLDDAAPDFFVRVGHIVDQVRRGGGPGFLVLDTFRLGPHSKGDDVREAAELEMARERDALSRCAAQVAAADRRRIDDANRAYLAHIEEAACASPIARYHDRPRHIFTRSTSTRPADVVGGETPVTVRVSLNQALRRLLTADDRVILLGEDLHDPYGGAFKVTAGLSTDFPGRVISSPISEAAIVGAGIGLALAGGRPIVEIMFADFVTLAMDQLLNHAVKFASLFPDTSVPLVVRTPAGGRRGYGPTHSQSPEGLLAAIPGLTLVAPSHRHEAGLLLERAVRDWGYPTVLLEHKLLYALPGDPDGYDICPADARDPAAHLFPTLSRGPADADVTFVTSGGMLPTVEAVATRLASEEISVRVVAVSLLAPLPRHSLTSLLRGAERLVIVEEAHTPHGVGAELGAALLERGYTGQFLRIGTPPVPIPAARSLEADVIPNEDSILAEVGALCHAHAAAHASDQ